MDFIQLSAIFASIIGIGLLVTLIVKIQERTKKFIERERKKGHYIFTDPIYETFFIMFGFVVIAYSWTDNLLFLPYGVSIVALGAWLYFRIARWYLRYHIKEIQGIK